MSTIGRRGSGALVALALLASGCGEADPVREPAGVRVVFALRGAPPEESFVAFTEDAAVIGRVEAELRLPPAERRLFVSGTIARGDGGVNSPWHWHFVPGAWDLVEVAVEVCDGRPSDVESDPDHWVDKVGAFCPWSSYVVQVD